MPLANLVQDRIDAAAAQAQRIAQQIPPLSDAVTVPIDVLQMVFAAGPVLAQGPDGYVRQVPQ